MKKFLVAAAAAALAIPAAAQAPASQGTGKFGFVHTERILRDSVPAVRAQKKIEAEFQKRDRELAGIADQLKRMQADLDRDAMTMSESQRRTKEREFGELRMKFFRIEKSNLPRGGVRERADLADQGLGVAGDAAAEARRDLPERERPRHVATSRAVSRPAP